MILERIKEYIDYKNISISAFEKSLGMSNASFSKSLKSGKGIGTDKLENILTIYFDISPDWLLTGEGPMLRNTEIERDEEKKNSNRSKKRNAYQICRRNSTHTY